MPITSLDTIWEMTIKWMDGFSSFISLINLRPFFFSYTRPDTTMSGSMALISSMAFSMSLFPIMYSPISLSWIILVIKSAVSSSFSKINIFMSSSYLCDCKVISYFFTYFTTKRPIFLFFVNYLKSLIFVLKSKEGL